VKVECAMAMAIPLMAAASAKRVRRFVGMENFMNDVLLNTALFKTNRRGRRGTQRKTSPDHSLRASAPSAV
jgi:hypothetical protein